jgi:hypothetical protein
MTEPTPFPGRDMGAALGVAFCAELAHEVHRIATGEHDRGEGLLWLIAVLTVGHPDLDHARAVRRVAYALLVETGPLIWEHARSSSPGQGLS